MKVVPTYIQPCASMMGFPPLEGNQRKPNVDGMCPHMEAVLTYISHVPRCGIFPSWRQPKKLPVDGMCPPHRGGFDIHPSIRPDGGISPTQRRTYDSLLMGFSHSEDRVYTFLDGMCPRVEVLTQTCL